MKKNILTYRYVKLCITALMLVPLIAGQSTLAQAKKKQPVNSKKSTINTSANSAAKTSDPEVLDINRSVKVINNQSGCNVSEWKNNKDEACECCLSYNKGRFGAEKTADEIIDYCTNESKQCDASSIASVKQKYNAKDMSSEDFLNMVYNSTTVINKMDIDPTNLQANGTMTEDGLANILAQAYNEGKLKNKDFYSKKCLSVKSLGSGSGYNTLQLFLVNSTCTPSAQPLLYIVKESKKGLTESTNLKKIEEYSGMEDIIAPNVVKDFPTIALPFFYFSYHPHHKNIHYIATMPGAKGSVLYDLFKEYRDDKSTKNAERIKKAYHILGKELSNFHKRFMKRIPGKVLGETIAHGDFHIHNIFYDEQTGHFTFIDNETMVRDLKQPKVPTIDFIRLIFPAFSNDDTAYQFKEMIQGIKPRTYLNITLTPFIKGYISAYDAQDRKQLLQDLRKIFTTNIQAPPLHFNAKYLNQIIKDDINPIFDDIEKTLG